MKKFMYALLLAFGMYAPVGAASDAPEKVTSKSPVNFEISNTDGYREIYATGEQISFYAEGKSPEPFAIDPKPGFHVQAMIVSGSQSKPYASANGVYDEEKHAWLVTLTAPSEPSNSYRVVISLYCARETGACAETYGQAAQTQKALPLQVH